MIRHVLLDADGVLQIRPGGWDTAMEPYLGERAHGFLRDIWSDELPMLAGRGGDYLPYLGAALRRYDVDAAAAEVYRDVWLRIETVEQSLDLVERLRAAGYGVHLGTNQERERAAYMRADLGYDALFDVSCYSCELGAAKPDPAFFVEAARRIGAPPADVLFVDDTVRNVEAARTVGMAAVHWSVDRGHDELLDALATHGVSPGPLGAKGQAM